MLTDQHLLFCGRERFRKLPRPVSREENKLKSQEIAVYRQIQRNTEAAMKAIDVISQKVYDDQLSMQIIRQSLKYSQIRGAALDQLLQAKAQPYQGSHIQDLMQAGAIQWETLFNTSTARIAELMIKNSNDGILEMNRVLNHNEQAGPKSLELARQLIDFENRSVERLTRYL